MSNKSNNSQIKYNLKSDKGNLTNKAKINKNKIQNIFWFSKLFQNNNTKNLTKVNKDKYKNMIK